MEQFIESGFWHAILVVVIVGIISSLILGILHLIFKKNYKTLEGIITSVPGAVAYMYIWQIRHGIGWLIFGIICIIWTISVVAALFIKKKP
jgi:hypothetical protein